MGTPFPVRYSTPPSRITRPGAGSQVTVPGARPVTVYDPAYPRVAFTAVCEISVCRDTACVGVPRVPPLPG